MSATKIKQGFHLNFRRNWIIQEEAHSAFLKKSVNQAKTTIIELIAKRKLEYSKNTAGLAMKAMFNLREADSHFANLVRMPQLGS